MDQSKLELLQAKKVIHKDARDLLKRAVDAGCTGAHLEKLCSFVAAVQAEIVFDLDVANELYSLDTPQGDPPD